MRLANFRGERKISDLVGRLFDISGPDAASREKRARDALLEANPHLKKLRDLPKGALILVPEVSGIPSATVLAPPAGTAEGILGAVAQVFSAADGFLEALGAQRLEATAASLELTKSSELRSAARKTAGAEELLSRATKVAESRVKEVEATTELQRRVFAAIHQDFEAFAATLADRHGNEE